MTLPEPLESSPKAPRAGRLKKLKELLGGIDLEALEID